MRNVQLSDALAEKRALGLKTVTRRPSTFVQAGDVVYHGEALVRAGAIADADRRSDPKNGYFALYRRDDVAVERPDGLLESWGWQRPVQIARYCPTRCARLFSLVREVRVEPLNAITEEQAIAEGMARGRLGGFVDPGEEDAAEYATAVRAFAATWNRIYGPGSFGPSPVSVLELGEPISREDAEWLASRKRGTTLAAWAERKGKAA